MGTWYHAPVQCLEESFKPITINKESVPSLEPDKPYCYLGVEITASMNWTQQVKKLKEAALSKGSRVSSSVYCRIAMLSAKQTLQLIQSSIRPAIVAIAYSMCLEIYTLYDIIARIAKKALGLPLSALVLKDRSNAGVGLMSLMVDNVQIDFAYLTKPLYDAGPLGCCTNAFLQAEQKCMGGMPTMKTELQDKGFHKFIKDFTS